MAITPQEWLAERFGEYYAQAKPSVPQVARREFGFGDFEKKIAFRHLSFENEQKLWERLARERPLYVSASVAYYEFPSGRPMIKKNWLGADLVFDLDQSSAKCAANPEAPCAPFTCAKCMESISQKAIALIEEFLIPDFGLSERELFANFSGSRGFHVRAYKKELEPLGREERREIVDYVEGNGVDFEQFFSEEPVEGLKLMRLSGPTPQMGGYKGKFARAAIKTAASAGTAGLIAPKLKKSEEAARFIKGIESGRWSDVKITNAKQRFREIFDRLKLTLSEEVETDANVTIDTSKVLRLPDSLHGSSGMAARTIAGGYKGLPGYEPMRDALAFSLQKSAKVKVLRNIPSIDFGGALTEKLWLGEERELPLPFAVYLVCKKAAVPAE